MKKEYSVYLPLVEGEDEVVEVGVNGSMYLLRRGQRIQVGEAVREALVHAGLIGEDEG